MFGHFSALRHHRHGWKWSRCIHMSTHTNQAPAWFLSTKAWIIFFNSSTLTAFRRYCVLFKKALIFWFLLDSPNSAARFMNVCIKSRTTEDNPLSIAKERPKINKYDKYLFHYWIARRAHPPARSKSFPCMRFQCIQKPFWLGRQTT